jgi:glycosyltransferase involved in cell wall biosynthesis
MQYHVAPQAYGVLRHAPADIVHVHSYRNFLADTASLVSRRRGLPLILHLHGSLAGYKHIVRGWRRKLYRAFDLLTAPLPTLRADRIVVSTSAEAREVADYGIDPSRIAVIPMGIDIDQYDYPELPRDSQRIVFVGRLAEDRNVELLIQALAQITDLEWSCMIIGSEERRSYASALGYVERLRVLAKDLGLAQRVTFTGPLVGEELRRAYAESGIFVYPSRYENFGQTILEAAAAGCALVTTRVGVASDLIRTGESGYILEDTTPNNLSNHIRWLLEHPNEQVRLGNSSRELARQHFGWQPILHQYSELYAEVIRAACCARRLSRNNRG